MRLIVKVFIGRVKNDKEQVLYAVSAFQVPVDNPYFSNVTKGMMLHPNSAETFGALLCHLPKIVQPEPHDADVTYQVVNGLHDDAGRIPVEEYTFAGTFTGPVTPDELKIVEDYLVQFSSK